MSETRDAVTDTCTYVANAASGNSARLQEIEHGTGGTTAFAYDAAGNQERASAGASTDFLYDGRSYLRDAAGVAPDGSAGVFCDGFETGDAVKPAEHGCG